MRHAELISQYFIHNCRHLYLEHHPSNQFPYKKTAQDQQWSSRNDGIFLWCSVTSMVTFRFLNSNIQQVRLYSTHQSIIVWVRWKKFKATGDNAIHSFTHICILSPFSFITVLWGAFFFQMFPIASLREVIKGPGTAHTLSVTFILILVVAFY